MCGNSAAGFAFYVNCWERGSLYQVVQAIAESLKVLGADAQDTNVKLERIRQVIKERPVVAILDDIDRVAPSERERIIYGLLSLPNTGVVCIANKKETLLSMEERTTSRLSPVVIECQPYGQQELEEILFDRAKEGLALDAWNQELLRQIAESAGGDARAALEALRHAAVAAESSGKKRIALSACADALRERRPTRQEEMLSRLSYHERLIHELALKHEPVLTTDLRRVYGNHCQKTGITPVARRTFSKYVKLMVNRGLLAVDPRAITGEGRLLTISTT
jgi:Cdc6-like AAA superfamily ATPase